MLVTLSPPLGYDGFILSLKPGSSYQDITLRLCLGLHLLQVLTLLSPPQGSCPKAVALPCYFLVPLKWLSSGSPLRHSPVSLPHGQLHEDKDHVCLILRLEGAYLIDG
jgi:hypothetical protein